MVDNSKKHDKTDASTRRQMLKQVGLAAAAGVTPGLLTSAQAETPEKDMRRKVKYRTLGKTHLRVSEIGFGGHSWAYKQAPEAKNVDICTCGVHTMEQTKENLSASWTKLSPKARERIKKVAAVPVQDPEYAWLEQDWQYA